MPSARNKNLYPQVLNADWAGQGMLSGTQARIYVPEDVLSAYRTDFFWSAHTASISPGDHSEGK